MQRDIDFKIRVRVDDACTDEEAGSMLEALINIGLADAHATLEEKEAENLDQAQLAASVEISSPVVLIAPKVLVVYADCEVDIYQEGDVDAVKFDWDTYNFSQPGEFIKLPVEFHKLALDSGVPEEACI